MADPAPKKALLEVTINDPELDSKAAEIGYCVRALQTVVQELGRGGGEVKTGEIVTYSTGLDVGSLGKWKFTSHKDQSEPPLE